MSDSSTDGTDSPAGGQGGQGGAAATFSQADLDRIVGERLGRQKSQYETQIADLKPKAEKFDELDKASKTESQRLQDERDRATASATEAAGKASAAELAALRLEVALDKGIPKALAVRLQGSTREEIEADAAQLAQFQRPASLDLGQGRGRAGADTTSMNDLIRRAAGR